MKITISAMLVAWSAMRSRFELNFIAETTRVYADTRVTFPAAAPGQSTVLQRGVKPYVEIGTAETDLTGPADFSPADGDIVYVSFASPAAKDRAPQVFNSGPWRKLSANRDNRVFVVNNEVWQTGQGVVAETLNPRAMLPDPSIATLPIQR